MTAGGGRCRGAGQDAAEWGQAGRGGGCSGTFWVGDDGDVAPRRSGEVAGALKWFGEGREGGVDQRAQPCGGEGGAESHSRPSPRSSLLRTAFLLLLLTSATWLLGLLAVNSDALTFHYLFAVFSCLQVGGRQGERASLGEATGHLCSLPSEVPGGRPRGHP